MLENEMLREQFEALLAREMQAADAYEDLASRLGDPALREQIQQLLMDKRRHVQLTERLLEIVA